MSLFFKDLDKYIIRCMKFHCPKKPSVFYLSLSLLTLTTTHLFIVSTVLPFPECCIVRIIWHMWPFLGWFLLHDENAKYSSMYFVAY